jgi:hypothetical protein
MSSVNAVPAVLVVILPLTALAPGLTALSAAGAGGAQLTAVCAQEVEPPNLHVVAPGSAVAVVVLKVVVPTAGKVMGVRVPCCSPPQW